MMHDKMSVSSISEERLRCCGLIEYEFADGRKTLTKILKLHALFQSEKVPPNNHESPWLESMACGSYSERGARLQRDGT